jgi:hypothetical protein
MDTDKRGCTMFHRRATRLGVAVLSAALALAGAAYGSFEGLPTPASQINNDPPSIDPTQKVGLADLTTGSVIAGNARVPWVAFSQPVSGSGDQIFVRAFKGGAWHTEGFPQSLNEDASQNASAPSIDFTGPGRSVPWVAWAEPSTKFSSATEIFASRFTANASAQNGGQWIHEGQQVTGTAPSLNINTNRDAADPSLFGGTTMAGNNPAPWVTWQEAGNGNTVAPTGLATLNKVAGNSTFQIFVSHAVQATAGTCPAGTKPAHGTSVGIFCFQQVGIDRIPGPASGNDPSLNVDPTRDGIQGDIAFTGANDSVPWVVWYENSDNGKVTNGLLNADLVFAARGVPDPTNGDGRFHWQVVGLGTAGKTATDDVLDGGQSAHGPLGECAQTQANELACSLDADQTLSDAAALTDGNGAENPTVAAGTMAPGHPTTPWIAWDESNTNGGLHSVFVARLDSAGDHFDMLNNGQPISNSALNSTRPDIVFSHNTPYVSWREQLSPTKALTFVGHFDGPAANPVFHLDTTAGIDTTPTVSSDDDQTDVRSPIASTCPADPFTNDGSACQGGATGTPLLALSDGTPRALFAQAYQPDNVQTAPASGTSVGATTFNGSVNPAGAPVQVEFNYGPTTGYGKTTAPQLLLPSESPTTFQAALTGLPSGELHYQAVAVTDVGTFPGPDQSVTIPTATVNVQITSPHGRVAATKLKKIAGSATATLGVSAVDVVVVRVSRGAHVDSARHGASCQQLGSDGRLHRLAAHHGVCKATKFLPVSGTTSWTLRLKRPLPNGHYVAIARATDTAGHSSLSRQDRFQVG